MMWLLKRIILGVILTGVGLAAWNWYHQGEKNEAAAAIPKPIAAAHEEPQKPEATPQNCQGDSQRPLAPPAHLPVMGNDGWPAGIRQLKQEAQRKQLYIYLPPNISREEAERW